ncbi:hypothetical protein ACS5PU_20950 [Pedobacter sp. GSP4]|uniref:hypothetical protein n=1 Tax=Pedobacter sp. GSP4 TaxID=3453716 RepID=UPI003EEF2BFE
MKAKLNQAVFILSCALLVACKNDRAKETAEAKVKKKPAACCSSNLPSRFGFKKLTANVPVLGSKQSGR